MWHRKLVRDLHTGDVFSDLPILRVKFCCGATRSLFPAEVWRGRATVTSVLETTAQAATGGIDQALEWSMAAGDGDELVSERTVRRWIKRAADRVPLASALLRFPAAPDLPAVEKLDNFATHLHRRHLLELRCQWGFSLLDCAPPAPDRPRTALWPKPGHQNPAPPHDPPSRYLRRGTRSRLARRGRPPDG